MGPKRGIPADGQTGGVRTLSWFFPFLGPGEVRILHELLVCDFFLVLHTLDALARRGHPRPSS